MNPYAQVPKELLDRIPKNHWSVLNGMVMVDAVGLIHLTTAIEELYPNKAIVARKLRYQLQAT